MSYNDDVHYSDTDEDQEELVDVDKYGNVILPSPLVYENPESLKNSNYGEVEVQEIVGKSFEDTILIEENEAVSHV